MSRLLQYSVAILLILGACVPKQEFQKVAKQKEECEEQLESLKSKTRSQEVENKEQKSRIEVLENKIEKLEQDSISRAKRIRSYKKENEKLRTKYEDLKETQEKLLKGTTKETRELLGEIQNSQEELQAKEDKLKELEENLNKERQNLSKLKKNLEDKQERLVELERILNEKDSVVQALKNRVSDALLGFEGEGLDVKIKNGKVYVSLEEKLLFPSGSTQIDNTGKEALKKLAKVLERNKDINIMVEGHTDNVPYISDKAIKDNWDLSVKRATAVIRILMDNSNIEGERIIAAGRSKYLPLEPNDSDASKRKNRRTEIILTPKLDELLEILNTN
ncbi:MAG: OmpA family protein [Bacteroidales bacterium]